VSILSVDSWAYDASTGSLQVWAMVEDAVVVRKASRHAPEELAEALCETMVPVEPGEWPSDDEALMAWLEEQELQWTPMEGDWGW
jgi:hypothetical protein